MRRPLLQLMSLCQCSSVSCVKRMPLVIIFHTKSSLKSLIYNAVRTNSGWSVGHRVLEHEITKQAGFIQNINCFIDHWTPDESTLQHHKIQRKKLMGRCVWLNRNRNIMLREEQKHLMYILCTLLSQNEKRKEILASWEWNRRKRDRFERTELSVSIVTKNANECNSHHPHHWLEFGFPFRIILRPTINMIIRSSLNAAAESYFNFFFCFFLKSWSLVSRKFGDSCHRKFASTWAAWLSPSSNSTSVSRMTAVCSFSLLTLRTTWITVSLKTLQ